MTKPMTKVYFKTDKNGKELAFRWCQFGHRTIRISGDDARLRVATGRAVLSSPMH